MRCASASVPHYADSMTLLTGHLYVRMLFALVHAGCRTVSASSLASPRGSWFSFRERVLTCNEVHTPSPGGITAASLAPSHSVMCGPGIERHTFCSSSTRLSRSPRSTSSCLSRECSCSITRRSSSFCSLCRSLCLRYARLYSEIASGQQSRSLPYVTIDEGLRAEPSRLAVGGVVLRTTRKSARAPPHSRLECQSCQLHKTLRCESRLYLFCSALRWTFPAILLPVAPAAGPGGAV